MRSIERDGVTLAVIDEGEGTPVLLLHGFPDSSHLWRHQLAALRESGFRVIAPDLRGLGESDKPQEVEAYEFRHLLSDVVAVLDALEVEHAHVVGHDWGAGLAWALAALQPRRVDRLAVLSVGHPNTELRTLEQRQRFWYQLLFQFDGVAEELLARDDWALFRELARRHADVDRAVRDLSRPGALTAALNWYRANAHPAHELERRRRVPAVAAPTLGMWSSGDDYLLEEPMRRSGDHVKGAWRYERLDGAGHWLQLDAPERVNELLLEWLS